MCKFYRIIVIVCATAMLLCGCNNEAVPGGTEPSDILSSQLTNPTNKSTDPTTEPTAPTIPSTEPEKPSEPYRPAEGEWIWDDPNDFWYNSFLKYYPHRTSGSSDK